MLRPLTSKKTVLALLLILLGVILLSVIIPQQFSTPATEFDKWQQAHQSWQPTLDALRLHHIFTTSWFAAILFLFLLALAIATQVQLRIAYKRTFGAPNKTNLSSTHGLSLPEETLTSNLLKNGYTESNTNQRESSRYRKHPWGHWGIFFLHLGILITVTASLFFAVSTQRGAFQIIEGETHLPTDPWIFEELGIFADSFQLPQAIRLDKITPEFWPQGGIKNLKSNVRFISAQGNTTQAIIATNPILTYEGLRIYQETKFGNAFYVWLTADNGDGHGLILDIGSPIEPAKASYGNFDFPEISYLIKAKYYADADKRSLISNNPLLTLRLMEQDKVIGEIPLTKGQSGQLGPYKAEFVRFAQWTNFTFMTTPGINGVFFGFFIFSLGGLLYYFTIPREFYFQKTDTGFLFSWKCARFQEHYQEEYQSIINCLQQTESQ